MGDFSWLQFSDLHFHTGDLYDTQRARQALVKCLAQEQFECDYVFFTGDLVQKNNYENADKHMATIRNEIKVDPNNIFWAVGNHDIRRDSIIRESIITRIRNATNPSTEFQTVMADEESRIRLTYSGMSDYIREYERLFDRKLSPEEISDVHVFYSLDHCNLIVLNTCLTSCNKDDFRKLMITEPRLLEVFDKATDKSKPLIVIGHHNKEVFHHGEQKELATLFEDGGVDFYLCGHLHQLGYARFDDSGRDIPQFTCGAGTIGRNEGFAFLHGKYDAARHSVSITPFSYSMSTKRFAKDFSLHRRLIENNSFILDRLKTASAAGIDPPEPGYSQEDKDLFDRSQRYYDFLRSEEGRYSYLLVEEQLFSSVKRPETRVKGSNTDDESQGLLEVLKNPEIKNLLIIGDGGMGKTVALLHIWEEFLETRTGELPFYVPLNEYRPHPEFIRNYIKLHYDKTDIYGLKRSFVLLLDGLNETSGDIHPLIREIKDVMSQRFDFARIVITSRSGFAPEHQMGSFVPQYLQPLDQQAVLDYLEKKNRKLGDTPIAVLQTPMMLTLFTQTCSVQDAIKHRDLFEFKPNTTRGELLYNYLLCQVANCVLNGRSNEIEAMWHTLFTVAPYIAHHMELTGTFQIDKQVFAEKIAEFEKHPLSYKRKSAMPEKLRQYTDRYESISIETEDILVYRQVLLVEEVGQYRFRHQYFRDFFASLHVVNAISNSLTTEPFLLPPEVSKHAWSVYVRDMLGDYYGDYRHKQGYDPRAHTDLHELLGKLRGLPGKRYGITVNNIIETWRRARRDCIIGEDLTRLDLNHVPLYAVILSGTYGSSSFNGSIISDITLLPQGHLGLVDYAVYSPDGSRVLSGSRDRTIKEWDRLTGECLRTFEGHENHASSAVYSPDGSRVLSGSWDSTIKEWDLSSRKLLWSSLNIGGIVITGCDFRGCSFSSPEIEEIVKRYGGRTISPFLTGIRGKYLREIDNDIELSLSADSQQNLILTGQNGSGKTSLLLVIKQAMESVLVGGRSGETTVEFSGGTYSEATQALQIEHTQGFYRLAHLKSPHLYDEAKSKLWERLDQTQKLIESLVNEGKAVEAAVRTAWLERVAKMLSGLWCTEVDLVYRNDCHDVYHWVGGKKVQLNRVSLPDGYSATLHILSTIISLWNDMTIPYNRIRGLILIDEPEAHLDVAMQKALLPFLTKEFPNIQVIVATYSPFILASANNAIVYDMVKKEVVKDGLTEE